MATCVTVGGGREADEPNGGTPAALASPMWQRLLAHLEPGGQYQLVGHQQVAPNIPSQQQCCLQLLWLEPGDRQQDPQK